jgi:hypothetical protein
MGHARMSVCLPACTAGGLVAGIGMAIVGQRHRHGIGYWLAASAIILLTVELRPVAVAAFSL